MLMYCNTGDNVVNIMNKKGFLLTCKNITWIDWSGQMQDANCELIICKSVENQLNSYPSNIIYHIFQCSHSLGHVINILIWIILSHKCF
jgi:hypothetical protein